MIAGLVKVAFLTICAAVLAAGVCAGSAARSPPLPATETSIAAVAADFAAKRVTAEGAAAAYLGHIAVLDPKLHAIIALNRRALGDARASDQRRAVGHTRSKLDGIPILVKDNIDVAGMATTAGSLALMLNVPGKDAPVVRRLRASGAVILGKTNLSEWANIRSTLSTSGWSAVAGLTHNPYALDRSACGSSSGSAVAVAANLAAAAIGTETDGSIVCPASMNGLVGLKPTVGLLSRAGIVPISHTQDTPGPLARSVPDAAALLTVMAGSDPADPATRDADLHRADYAKGLDANALKGARIGALRFLGGFTPQTLAVFEAALAVMKAQGAIVVDIDRFEAANIGGLESIVLHTELKTDLNAYLAATPPTVATRTLADLIAFNRAEPRELAWFGQDLFERAQATLGLDDPLYRRAAETAHRSAGPDGIDRLLRENDVIALVAPTTEPAAKIDLGNGDALGASSARLPAVAGYPHLTVPMGQVHGLPVGLSFIGPAWSEQPLLSLGYAFEQATHARVPPTYAASLD